MSRLRDFQAVVLAGGSGVRLFPLASDPALPKHTLPVCNKPLISYVVSSLVSYRMSEIIVVTSESQKSAVYDALLAFVTASHGTPGAPTSAPSTPVSAQSQNPTIAFSIQSAAVGSLVTIGILGAGHATNSTGTGTGTSTSTGTNSSTAASASTSIISTITPYLTTFPNISLTPNPSSASVPAAASASHPGSSASSTVAGAPGASPAGSFGVTGAGSLASANAGTNLSGGSGSSSSNASVNAGMTWSGNMVPLRLFISANADDSASSVRMLAERQLIKRDFFVLPGDLISLLSLRKLADLHRTHSATVSVMLVRRDKEKEAGAASAADSDDGSSSQFVGLDANDRKRLLYYAAEGDLDDSVDFSKSALLAHRNNMRITNALLDTHIYVFAKSVADLLIQKRNFESLRHNLVPYLVRNQFKHSASFQPPPVDQELALTMSSAADNVINRIPCIAYVPEEKALSIRVLSVKAYLEANFAACLAFGLGNGKEIGEKFEKKLFIGQKDCCVGAALRFEPGDKPSSIKRCVVGDRVAIGKNVRLERSVIMDDVVIPDGVTISGSVVGRGVRIPAGVQSIKNTSVAPGYVFEDIMREYTSATLHKD
eukprot:ANDGO_00857.mRNA.1 Translation initiation factor eIF-2B subunit gamma